MDGSSRPALNGAPVLGGIAAALVATLLVAVNVVTIGGGADESGGVPYVRLYDLPDSALERMLNQGDGQAFAAIAQDPLLRRPEVFRGGADEAAYRAQRPLLGYVGWALSGGQRAAVPLALAAAVVASVGFMAATAVALAQRSGLLWRPAVFVALLPGSLIAIDWVGPEPLATALAIAGLLLWTRPQPRVGAAVVAFSLAALARETLLVVPAALVLYDLKGGRRAPAAWLLLPAVAYAGWVVLVRTALGAWPFAASEGRLAWPFAGLVDVAAGWGTVDLLLALIGLALAAIAVARHRTGMLGLLVIAHIALAVVMGEDVWKRWEDFSRPLLPLYAFSLVAVLPRSGERGERAIMSPTSRLSGPSARRAPFGRALPSEDSSGH